MWANFSMMRSGRVAALEMEGGGGTGMVGDFVSAGKNWGSPINTSTVISDGTAPSDPIMRTLMHHPRRRAFHF